MPLPQKLFVVDDEKIVADPVSLVRQCAGFEVGTFYGGQQAVERLALTGPPNVVGTDIEIRMLDGISLAERVAHQWPSCKGPVPTARGRSVREDERVGTDTSSSGRAAEPRSLQQLIAKVRELCRHRPGAERVQ